MEFEVVLASGEVVNASLEDHPDVFWALKAGANNFGIVTQFTLRAVPMGLVWGGVVTYTIDHAPEILDALARYQSHGEKDTHSGLCIQVVPSMGVVFGNFLYSKPVKTPPEAFADFLAIPAVANTKIRSWYDCHNEAPGAPFTRWGFRTTTMKPDAGAYKLVLQTVVEETSKLDSTAQVLVLVLQPISRRLIERGAASGGNPQSLEDTEQTWLSFSAGWNLPEDDNLVYSVQQSTDSRVEAITKTANLFLPHKFMNDGAGDQDIYGSYGPETVLKLQRIAEKYDPGLVFQRQVQGGFKLFGPDVLKGSPA